MEKIPGNRWKVTLNHAAPDGGDAAMYDDPNEAARAVKSGKHAAVARHLATSLPDHGGFIDLANAGYDRESARLPRWSRKLLVNPRP